MEVQNNLQHLQNRVDTVIADSSKDISKKGGIKPIESVAADNTNVKISPSVFEVKERDIAGLVQFFNDDLKDIQKLKNNSKEQMDKLEDIVGSLKEYKEKVNSEGIQMAGKELDILKNMVDEFNATTLRSIQDNSNISANSLKKNTKLQEELETINGFKMGRDRSSFIGAGLTALIDNLEQDVDKIDNGILNSQRGMKELSEFIDGLNKIESSIVQSASSVFENVKNDMVKEVDFSKETENFSSQTITSFNGSVAFSQANSSQNSSVPLLV